MARSCSPFFIGVAAGDVSGDVFRIELDRLAVVSDNAVVLALLLIGAAAVGVSGGLFRIKLDRLAMVGDGAGAVALVPVDHRVPVLNLGCQTQFQQFGLGEYSCLCRVETIKSTISSEMPNFLKYVLSSAAIWGANERCICVSTGTAPR